MTTHDLEQHINELSVADKNNTMNKTEQIMPTSAKGTMKKLIPVLSKKEKQEILAYYTVYEKYEEEFFKKATEDLKDHPIFGKLIRDIPKEVSEASNKLSRELQKDAILNDNWQPYIDYQIEQGITYAKMGLDFKSWYEVVSLVRNYITPYLQKEYGSGAKLISSLKGMNCFLDIAMDLIGEAYLQEKEVLIKEDRERIKKLNEELEWNVVQLEASNKELEAFSYSISHDLRAPLRHIGGFVDLLIKNNSPQLDETGMRYLNIISESSNEMGNLIDAILSFSKLNRGELNKTTINSQNMVKKVLSTFSDELDGRDVEINISELPDMKGDEQLINQVWENLISNAIKYSRKKEKTVIDIGGKIENGEIIFHVNDNGAGFDMNYASKLFGVFQRLHKTKDFEGIGIGLANVNRIVVRHGGKCRAESEVDKGAAFFFSVPVI